MNRKLLYENIVDDIRARMRSGELAAADPLPPVQQLCRHYQVSHITVLRSLKELNAAGVIHRHGRGYRVAPVLKLEEEFALSSRATTIGLFLRSYWNAPDNYFNQINQAIENELFASRMDTLRSHFSNVFNYCQPDSSGEYAEADEILRQMLAIARRCCGLLVDERVSDRILAGFLQHSDVPVVVVNRASELPVGSIAIPNFSGVKLLLDAVLTRGYTDIFFCGTAARRFYNDYQRFRALEELTAQEEYAGRFRMHWHTDWEVPFEVYYQKLYSALTRLSPPRKPLILAPSDLLALELYKRLSTRDCEVGRDYGLCGFYGSPVTLPGGRIITSVRVNTDAVGSSAVKLLLKFVHNPWCERKEGKEVGAELVYGDTA
ncbi:GntR family transcriptional regulator [Victivallis sp. Marseille-Q1083]|uniref:GntR family transcriptional regulator n=1 Tax=Victivallis sp. Marseille-Q1083 TaxID=2717288 RepID=UPI001588D664|nr:GntR family transcriptional regulator [Victivallis sp. Marseille-Q1083]